MPGNLVAALSEHTIGKGIAADLQGCWRGGKNKNKKKGVGETVRRGSKRLKHVEMAPKRVYILFANSNTKQPTTQVLLPLSVCIPGVWWWCCTFCWFFFVFFVCQMIQGLWGIAEVCFLQVDWHVLISASENPTSTCKPLQQEWLKKSKGQKKSWLLILLAVLMLKYVIMFFTAWYFKVQLTREGR